MKNVMRFSGMGLQMATLISFGTYLGYRIDLIAGRWSDTETPLATLLLSLLFTFLALILVIRQALKMNK
ncbi:MAG: AtpZ/AtpI family protein [Schleiferiaceae bacterium]|nr:AtpZ/AtpI family protein [Schleiferiaceae bacterium]MDG1881883.1 AtpZ/AtpI family protein [Schleiferiaceae bacterium]